MSGRLWNVGDRVALRPLTGVVADVGSGGDTYVEFDHAPDSWVEEDCLRPAPNDSMMFRRSVKNSLAADAAYVAAAMRPSWEMYFLGIAKAVAARADCSRAQHGAVIVDQSRRIVSTGYNGSPSGSPGCLTDGACPRARLSYDELPAGSSYDTGPGACISLHAEANALLYGDWAAFQGGTIFITGKPCGGCMKLIRGSGLSRVVTPFMDGCIEEWL